MRKTLPKLAVATLALLFGVALYLLFRPATLLMFEWADRLGFGGAVSSARDAVNPYSHLLPGVLLNSLPNALWLLFLLAMIDLIWSGFPRASNLLQWKVVVLVVSVEFAQAGWARLGTFDWWDVAVLCGVASAYLLPVAGPNARESMG